MGTLISAYLELIIEKSGMTRNELFQKMGYKNTTKAFRRLQEVFNGSKDCTFFLENICKVLNIPLADLMNKIDEYNDQLLKEQIDRERKSFRPHIFALTSRQVPSPIFVGAITFSSRFYFMDNEFLELERIDQLATISLAVREHHLKTDGGIPGFGKIIGYVYKKNIDQYREDMDFFDVNGALTDDPGIEHHINAKCRLTVKGRDITNLFNIESENDV